MTETFPGTEHLPEPVDLEDLQQGQTVSYYWRESGAWHGPRQSTLSLILGRLSLWQGTQTYKVTSGRVHVFEAWS